MSSSPNKVLVIAEDTSVRSHLRQTLETSGFDTGEASDNETARMRLRMVDYDAVLLDLPGFGMDGLGVCSQLRSLHPRLPVLILSDSDGLDNKVQALEAGADDYLVRPLADRELSARLRSAIRRYRAPDVGESEYLSVGNVRLDLARYRLEKSGAEISLTPLEFRALHILMAQAGRPVTHVALLTMLWGPERAQHRQHLRVLISTLRKKLEDDPANPVYLLTHSHFGYLFQAA
jgi:two-component system, OmpR family, KDP operon response regulator KdpE